MDCTGTSPRCLQVRATQLESPAHYRVNLWDIYCRNRQPFTPSFAPKDSLLANSPKGNAAGPQEENWGNPRQPTCSRHPHAVPLKKFCLTISRWCCGCIWRACWKRGLCLWLRWGLIVIRGPEHVHSTGRTSLLPLKPGAQAAVGRTGKGQH